MRRPKSTGAVIVRLAAILLVMASAWFLPPARGEIILETAAPGPNPTPAVGIGGAQWIGARFSIAEWTQVDEIGVNLSGASTIFGAIVSLSGPDGLPTPPPSQIESFALAGTSFPVSSNVGDYTTSLSATLAPGDYGVVFGVDAYGSTGGANLTDGNIPTSQASFFIALPLNGDVWQDAPDLSGLRIFVTGAVVPEPSSLIPLGVGMGVVGALEVHRRLRSRAG